MVIVRFNFLNSIHNFISNNFFFQFFHQLLLLYIVASLALVKYKFFNIKIYNLKSNLNYMFVLFFILSFNLLVYLYFEFLCLIYKDVLLTGLFKKNKILYYFILYTYIMLFIKNIRMNVFFIDFFESIYFNILFYKHYKNLRLYSLHLTIFFLIYCIFLNFYFIGQNNFILCKNIINFNVNSTFVGGNNYFIVEHITNRSFNNSIFYKFNYFYGNVFLEVFSFNSFVLFIININTLFFLFVVSFLNFFKLIFEKKASI